MPRLQGREGPLRLATRKALALVVLLTLEGPMRRERLAELLWPDLDRATARRNLRREVFRLREIGLAMVDAGTHAIGLEAVALAWPTAADSSPLWLEGLDTTAGAEFDEWAMLQRERLQRLWLDRLDDQAAALAAGGDEPAALRLRRQIHDHRGGQPTALPAGPAKAAPDPLPGAAGLPVRLPFVGRQALLADIARAVQAGRVVFIDGAPGAGKTRLALQAGAGLGGTLIVRCRPDDAAQPYASALRLLQALLEAAPDTALEPWVRRELSPLVPAWADAGVPEADVQAGERLQRAFDHAWRRLARDNFGALLLDDWQWADASSLALWSLESPPDRDAPVARLVVHRSAELPPALLQRRRQLLDSGRAVAVQVPPLTEAELQALLQACAQGDGAGLFSERLHTATGGNPQFVLETLRHLAFQGLLPSGDGGRWQLPADAPVLQQTELALPGGVRDLVLARVYALGPAVRAVLETASLAGDEATPRLLAQVSGLDELATAQAVDHACAAQLLVDDGQGQPRFTHDLVAQSLADALSGTRRQVLQGRLADALIAHGGAPGRVAALLAAAGRTTEAASWHLRAGQAAHRVRALAEALVQFEAARSLADDADLRVQAQLEAAAVLRLSAGPETVDAALDAALVDAQAVGVERGQDVLLARAAHLSETNRVDESLALLERLRSTATLTPAQRLRLAEETAGALSNRGRHADALPLLRHAMDEMPPTALSDRARLLGTLARVLAFSGDQVAGFEVGRERVNLCAQLGDLDGEASALGQVGAHLRDQGRRDEALQALNRACELARRGGSVRTQRVALYQLCVMHTDVGRVDLALPLADEGEALSPSWDGPAMQQGYLRLRLYLHQMRGDADAALAAAARMLDHARTLDHVSIKLGSMRLAIDLQLLLGQQAAAGALLDETDQLVQALHGHDYMQDQLMACRVRWLQRQGQAAEALHQAKRWLAAWPEVMPETRLHLLSTAADAALDLQDAATAQRLLARLPPLTGLPLTAQAVACATGLRLARASQQGLADALAQARALLSGGQLPAFSQRQLQAALDAAA